MTRNTAITDRPKSPRGRASRTHRTKTYSHKINYHKHQLQAISVGKKTYTEMKNIQLQR